MSGIETAAAMITTGAQSAMADEMTFRMTRLRVTLRSHCTTYVVRAYTDQKSMRKLDRKAGPIEFEWQRFAR